jgi:hypothetical protein
VNVNGAVFVAVKKESVAVSFENLRHASKLPRVKRNGDRFCRTVAIIGSAPVISDMKSHRHRGVHVHELSCHFVGKKSIRHDLKPLEAVRLQFLA